MYVSLDVLARNNQMSMLSKVLDQIIQANQTLSETQELMIMLQNRIKQILTKDRLSTFDLHQLRIYSELMDSLSNRENSVQNHVIKKIELLIKHSEAIGIKPDEVNLDDIINSERLKIFVDKQLSDPKEFTEQRLSNTIFTENLDEDSLTD